MEKIIKFREQAQKSKLLKVTKITSPKTNKVLESFHVQEAAYKKGSSLPISARGFFVSPEDNSVIIRGYNKFFNINEIRQTKWEYIEEHTVGPYELTLKENGCIIFVSVFEDDLIVTSKHSITKINDQGHIEVNNYSELGEKWLYKYIGDKKDKLIKFIKDNKVTLIFELVDNEFEEHVLEYTREEDGLYLHGINENKVEFDSWPSNKVHEVAKEFNLRPVEYLVYDNIPDLKKFAESCNGYYNNRAIEGWVIRCRQDNGEVFFFKYKYDEPYLLYREWREAMGVFLNNKTMRYRYPQTHDYMKFIKELYQTDKYLFDNLSKKKGIIRIRKLFLEQYKDGKYVPKLNGLATKENAKYKLIVPIGLSGFGKTTMANMLKSLYNNVEHVESNNFRKKVDNKFVEDVINAFSSSVSVIIADRYNHMRKYRGELINSVHNLYPNTLWTVAIHWNIKSVPKKEVLEFIRERVETRDKNHNVITPERSPDYPFLMKTFLDDFEDIDRTTHEDHFINDVVEVEMNENSVSIVKKIIKALNLEPKTDEEIENAYKKAIEIKITHKQKPEPKKPLYYGLRIKYMNCREVAMEYLKNYSKQHTEYADDYDQVKSLIEKSDFMQREHVELNNQKNSTKKTIEYYDNLIGSDNTVQNFNNPDLEAYAHVSSIVWTSKALFMPVDKIESDKVKERMNDDDNEPNYYIMLARKGEEKSIRCPSIIKNIKTFYEQHPDLKPTSIPEDSATLVDETFMIDETNKEKEKEIIHPETLIQLLPTSIKNTSFIKPIKIVNGQDWKQLLFEPIKVKG